MFGPWSEGGFQLTPQFPTEAWLPRLSDFADQVPAFSGLTVHLGLVFGLVAAVLVHFLLYRSRLGYEIRLIGDSPRAARYAGVNVVRNTIIVFAISGALAGLAGMSEVSGVVHRLQLAISPGLRLHGGHRGLHREAQPVRRRRRRDRLRRPHPRRPRDPAVGDPGDDPGDHPLLRSSRARSSSATASGSSGGPPDGPHVILAAGVATGTVLLFAAVGEIFAERAGVLNLGVEGMMLMGAVVAFGDRRGDRQPMARAGSRDAGRRSALRCSTPSSRSPSRPSRSSPASPSRSSAAASPGSSARS